MGLPNTAYFCMSDSGLLQPVAVLQKVIGQAGFFAARLRMPVVAPAHHGGQRHQDGLGTPAGLQTKQGAAVKHQVKLNVAATAVSLELALGFGKGCVAAAFDNGQVGVQIGIAHGTHKGKTLLKTPLVQVIKKQAANSAWLIAVPEVKIAVAPCLVFRVYLLAKGCAGITGDPVPVHAVFRLAVVGCQVKAATKPRSEERRVGKECRSRGS